MSQIIGGHVFVPLERNIDDVKLNAITGGATITSELISTQTLSTSAVTNDQFLILKAAGTLARILYDDLATSLAAATGTKQAIWSVRLRSFNAAGNPNFEVDQRNVGNLVSNPAAGAFAQDRWRVGRTASTMAINTQRLSTATGIPVPGTSFEISANYLLLTLATAQASLAAADHWDLVHTVEGSNARELLGDVHSFSLLVASSVSGLKFGVAIRDVATTKSLTKLCTIPAANTNTLITLPNLPVFAAGGNWKNTPGIEGYEIRICLACGSTSMSPANDTWQNGNFIGAVGQDNFAAQAVNSTFTVMFIQHEPGPLCTTLIDKPFTQNYDECLRYFYKTYDYETALGTVTNLGAKTFVTPVAGATAFGPFQYPKPLAKVPGLMTFYNVGTGAANSVRDGGGVDHASAAANSASKNGFMYLSFATATTGAMQVYVHFASDTAW